jgi:uncharacterized protein (DUF1330 family)
MPAYMIVQLKVTDPDKFARYREAVPSVVEAFGGRYIVRGASVEGAGRQPRRPAPRALRVSIG